MDRAYEVPLYCTGYERIDLPPGVLPEARFLTKQLKPIPELEKGPKLVIEAFFLIAPSLEGEIRKRKNS